MKVGEILGTLDGFAADWRFPVLDNAYIFLADVRLHAYRSDTQWAIVIEQLGFNVREDAHEQINAAGYAFGNALRTGLVLGPQPTADADEPLFDADDSWCVNPDARALLVRGQSVNIPRDPALYRSK